MLSKEVLSETLASSQASVASAAEKLRCELAKSSSTSSVCLAFLKVNGWKSDYPSVDLLLRHLSRKCRSEASRKAYLNRLYIFCLQTKMTPDQLISLNKRKIEELVQNYVDAFNDGNHSVRYLNNIMALLNGFFQANGFKKSQALNVESFYMPTRYRKTEEYIPTKNEIYSMADSACSLRDRAIILTLFSSGFRNSTLRSLLVRDIEEEITKNVYNIRLPCYPEMKLIDPKACKGNIPYFTFTCDEATQAIKLFLNERRERYGEIALCEPLFNSDYNQIKKSERAHKVMSSRQLQLIVKSCAQRAGLPRWVFVKPHSIRKASETVYHTELVGGGLLDSKIQEFFMGHILPGNEDAYLDKTKTEDLRVQFGKLNFGRVVIENKFKVLKTAIAKAFEGSGIDPEEVLTEYVRMQNTSLKQSS